MFATVLLLVSISAAAFASPVLPAEYAIGEKIVGGRDGDVEEVPYLVSVLVDGLHNCGGSIVSEFWVVSAAHCFTRAIARHTIRAGSSLRNSGGHVHLLETFINHPSYQSPALYSNDISLVKVQEPFHFSARIQPVLLPARMQDVPVGTFTRISGFGHLNWGVGPAATVLQIADVPIVDQESCAIANQLVSTVTDDMICAGFPEGGIDACQGDSGGPLVLDGKLIGAVSWGFRCAISGYPGVYARVPVFVDWIKEHTGL